MNQTDCFAVGHSTSRVENYRADWLEVTVARAVKPLRSAIESALLLLSDGACDHNACEGCKAEMHETVRILRAALDDTKD